MKLRLIGYWNGGVGPENEKWPDPKNFVCDLSSLDKQKILDYFESAVQMPYAAAGVSRCRFCGKDLGSGELTDGMFLWPEGLPHYVLEHSVKLPDEFLEQALGNTKIDSNLNLDLGNLEVDTEWWESKKNDKSAL